MRCIIRETVQNKIERRKLTRGQVNQQTNWLFQIQLSKNQVLSFTAQCVCKNQTENVRHVEQYNLIIHVFVPIYNLCHCVFSQHKSQHVFVAIYRSNFFIYMLLCLCDIVFQTLIILKHIFTKYTHVESINLIKYSPSIFIVQLFNNMKKKICSTKIDRDKQIHRHIYRQIDRQVDRQIERGKELYQSFLFSFQCIYS